MLRFRDRDWWWTKEPLGLEDPEPALLVAMLRRRGERERAHVWLARHLHRPYSPATGHAFLFTLRQKLERAGAPPDLVAVDAAQRAMVAVDAAAANDPETRAEMGLEPVDALPASA